VQHPRVRALHAAVPAWSPLLPALTCSCRAASMFLTSLTPRGARPRSGTLHLYSASKQTTGETGPKPQNKGNRRTGDRGRCIQNPAHMTVENAQAQRHRAACAHTAPSLPHQETATPRGDPGNRPKAPVSPVPPDPLPPFHPAQGRAIRATRDSPTAPTAAPTETSTPTRRHPSAHRLRPARNKAGQRGERPRHASRQPGLKRGPPLTGASPAQRNCATRPG